MKKLINLRIFYYQTLIIYNLFDRLTSISTSLKKELFIIQLKTFDKSNNIEDSRIFKDQNILEIRYRRI